MYELYEYGFLVYAFAPIAGQTCSLILYADGITPGAVLIADNRRKSVVWYGSFLEFGDKLSYEEVWIPIAVARTCAQFHPMDFPINCTDSAVKTAFQLILLTARYQPHFAASTRMHAHVHVCMHIPLRTSLP